MRGPILLSAAGLLVLGLGVLGGATLAYCSEVQMSPADLRAELTHQVEYLRPLIEATLSPSERQQFDRIRVVISSNETIASPFADVDASGPYITFTAGLARLVAAVTEAIYALPPRQSIQYIAYVVAQQQQAVAAAGGSPAAPPIKPFYEWANWSQQQINGYQADANLQRNIELTNVGVIGFIYAHEAGHHLLGHVANPDVDLPTKRDREMKADAFASEHLIRADVGPLVGVFAMVYFAALDCNALAHEQNLIHPADIRRISAVIQETENGLDQLQIKPGGLTRDQVREMLQMLSTNLQREIGNGNGCITSSGGIGAVPAPPGTYCYHLDTGTTRWWCSNSMSACGADRQKTMADPDFSDDHPTDCQKVDRMYCGSRRKNASSGVITFCHPTLDDCAADDGRRARMGALPVSECRSFSSP